MNDDHVFPCDLFNAYQTGAIISSIQTIINKLCFLWRQSPVNALPKFLVAGDPFLFRNVVG